MVWPVPEKPPNIADLKFYAIGMENLWFTNPWFTDVPC